MVINPKKLYGNWKEGYALDIHTIRSIYIGEDCFGCPQFDTTYSEIGNYLKNIKYRGEYQLVPIIVDVAKEFIVNNWKIFNDIDLILAVPPSKKREIQPLFLIVEQLGEALKKTYCLDYFEKLDDFEIKNLSFEEKEKINSSDIFKRNRTLKSEVNILLIDDLYDSGTTLKLICDELRKEEKVKDIYILTITKTRKG